jgi:ATP-binding cassette subfamily B (MDR/TAP) protein 1
LAFTVWYGSRLVMYHGYKGGTVYNVALVIVFGGGYVGEASCQFRFDDTY